jgi:hypothetical protein
VGTGRGWCTGRSQGRRLAVKGKTLLLAATWCAPAEERNVTAANIAVRNRLATVLDTARATDLFARILRAVRAERADQEKNCNGIVDL